jgi:hypothetical protein
VPARRLALHFERLLNGVVGLLQLGRALVLLSALLGGHLISLGGSRRGGRGLVVGAIFS